VSHFIYYYAEYHNAECHYDEYCYAEGCYETRFSAKKTVARVEKNLFLLHGLINSGKNTLYTWCNDTQHNDNQHNDNQHIDTQHNDNQLYSAKLDSHHNHTQH
jgi:hypothetical protein